MSRFGDAFRILVPCAAIAAAGVLLAFNFGQTPSPKDTAITAQANKSIAGASENIQLVAFQEPYTQPYVQQQVGHGAACNCQTGGAPVAGPVYGQPIVANQIGGQVFDQGAPMQANFASGCDTCGGEAFGQQNFAQQSFAQPTGDQNLPTKHIMGVDGNTSRRLGHEAKWRDSHLVPWEMFAYGEYIGPHRTPHVPEYRIRVDDQLEFVYMLTRERQPGPYRIQIGDVLQMSSAIDTSLNQTEINVISDGMISLPLIGQVQAAGMTVETLQNLLNQRYTKFVKEPAVVIQIVQGDTLLNDLRDVVDARSGQGGQSRQALVSPDGTIQLPLIGNVPAIGLSLDEIGREINTRYRNFLGGIEVTPVLLERAPRFAYVVGQVGQPGQFELTGPTTVIQALALAQGDLFEGNLRNVIVLRRDQNWRLVATRLDIQGTINGRRPYPSDDFYLRDSDIVIVPRKPITRLSEAVNLYLTNTLYQIFPEQLIFDLDGGLIGS